MSEQICDVTFPATFEDVRSTLLKIQDKLSSCSLSVEETGTLDLVLAEVLNNIVEHAYAETSTGDISLLMRWEANGIFCRISDRGRPLPGESIPSRLGHALPTKTAELPEGGFGWFLIGQLAHDLSYKRKDQRNELEFRVAISGANGTKPAMAS